MSVRSASRGARRSTQHNAQGRMRSPAVAGGINRWLKGSIIAGVFVLAVLFALVTASDQIAWYLPLGLAMAGVSGVLLLRSNKSTPIGLLLILATAGIANVISLPTGTASRIVLSLILSLGFTATWLFNTFFLHKNERHLLYTPLNAPVLAWCIVSIVAYAWSLMMRDTLLFVPSSFVVVQIAALVVNILLPLQMLLVTNTIGVLPYAEGVDWLRRMVYVVLAVAAIGIVAELLGIGFMSRFYSNGTRGLFSMWAVVLALALVLYDGKLPMWMRVLLLGIAGGWFYRDFVQHTVWLSGWLPMVVAVAVLTFLRSKKLFVLGVVIVLIYGAVNYNELYARIVTSNVDEGSTSRLDIWRVAIGHIVHHPLFGMGPAGYTVYYMTYNPLNARSTHNNYFDVLAQAGVIGMLIFLWLWFSIFRLGWRLTAEQAGEHTFEAGLAAAVTAGCVGGAAGMMLGDWVLPFAYNQTITGFDNAVFTWMLFGAAGALYALRAARAAATPTTRAGA